jgi:hypothetical protein
MKMFDIKQHPAYNLLFSALPALRLRLDQRLSNGASVIGNPSASTSRGVRYRIVKVGADFPLEPRATVTEACTELLDAALKYGKEAFGVPVGVGQTPILVWRTLPEIVWEVHSPEVSPHVPKGAVRIGVYMRAIVEVH